MWMQKCLQKCWQTVSTVIEGLIHIDQTAFMLCKGTDINMRHLFLNLCNPHDNPGARVIASLDAEKAFDSAELIYLWEIMRHYGFGPRYLHWLQLLVRAPKARVHTNDRLSDTFALHRGTRQDCPLSPSLFTLALEPLAILIRNSSEVCGLQVGCLEEKLSLYADDALLYLNDAGPSLLAVLQIFDRFGSFSGIKMNWSKSIFFPIDDRAAALGSSIPLGWVEEFRYLGLQVTRKTTDFFDSNIKPLLTALKTNCSSWTWLPLNLLGH